MSDPVSDLVGLSAQDKANVLVEALPWLQKWHGALVVLKYGGNAMVDDELKRAFAQDVVFLRTAGLRPVVVHGGGPQISTMLEKLDIRSEFRGGLRVTTPETMDVVRMVLTGRWAANSSACSTRTARSPSACPGGRRLAARHPSRRGGGRGTRRRRPRRRRRGRRPARRRRHPGRRPHPRHLHRRPEVDDEGNLVPGQVLNVNADTAASAIAVALGAQKFVVMTDVAGLYRDWPNTDSLVREIAADDLADLLPSLESGMVPKMEACLRAVRGGVPRATVIDGRQAHSVLLEVFTTSGNGTMVVP